MFLICIAILMLMTAVTCHGQVTRTHPFPWDKNITRMASQDRLMFSVVNNGKQDTIFVGMLVDSLKKNDYFMMIYVCYPKDINIDSSSFQIGFDNGIETMNIQASVKKDGYFTYRVSDKQCAKIKGMEIKFVNFVINQNNLSYSYNGKFFYDFFKLL